MQKEQTFETPFPELNKVLLGGFRLGTLVVVGGLTGMGKTSFLVSLMSRWTDVMKCFISIDESIAHMTQKIISHESEVPLDKLLTGDLTGQQFQRMVEATNRVASKDTTIFSEDRQNIFERIEEAIKLGCKIILIDTLQLIVNRLDIYQEMSLIVNKLKEIALKNEVCIIVTSQLNRKVYERQGHRPMLKDLETRVKLKNVQIKLFLYIEEKNLILMINRDKPKLS